MLYYIISDNEYEYFTKEELEKYFKKAYNVVIDLDKNYKRAISLKDPSYTVKVIVGIYVVHFLTSTFCPCLLLWISVNLAFLIPLAYKHKKAEIDKVVSQVKEILCQQIKLITSKIPKYVEKEKRN
jgi:hypothetical protein